MLGKIREFDWREKFLNFDAVRNGIRLIFNPELTKPDFIWCDLNDCNLEKDLAKIDLVIVDIDLTLVVEGGEEIHEKIADQFEQIRQLCKVACFTNKNSTRNQKIEEKYNIKVFTAGKKKKPNPTGYRKIAKENGIKDFSRILFVDDSLSTGIAGAKNLGMRTALIDYKSLLDNKKEKIWAKRVFGRNFDRFLLRRIFGKNAPFQN